jgi:hypothetical protein
MRLANGSPLIETLEIESLEPDDVINSGYFRQVDSAFATLAKRRKRMVADLAFANESLSPMRYAAMQVAANIESAKASLVKATFFQKKCIQFEQVAARALEGVDASQLRFDGDQYVGPTIACLAVEHPVANAHLELAYQELRWLASEDGRDFAGYLDIVLSELAKEGARSVGVTFIESLSENKIEVGKVVLVCKIGSELMNLLFSKRGIGVDVISVSDGRTVFQLNW